VNVGSETPATPHPVPSEPPHGSDAALGDNATGDIVVDAALRELQQAPTDDLDAQIEAGQRVHRTLQARLSDLGGE
jgi:DNA polymerase-3 subunit gamma/tau